MLRKLAARFDTAAFKPWTLPPDLVLGLALVPPVLVGLLVFQVRALEMLGISMAVGGTAHLVARLARQPVGMSPVLPALIGVALLGPANIVWAPVVAGAAALLELLRARLLPGFRIQTGLIAFGAVFIAAPASAAYLGPPAMRPLAEPVRLWLAYFGGAAMPVDPTRLYVGNVPGPVFATSLLAVAVGAAWLWYARRLSLAVLAGVLVGGLAASFYFRWSPTFQLDSGPLWFAAVMLADRRLLPGPRVARPVIGLAAGLGMIAVRSRGVAVEGAYLAVAALQMGIGLIAGANWLVRGRLLGRFLSRRRERSLAFPTVISGQAGEARPAATRRSA